MMTPEHYNRLVRLVEQDIEIELEVEVAATFYSHEDPNAYNTIGELPGADLAGSGRARRRPPGFMARRYGRH